MIGAVQVSNRQYTLYTFIREKGGLTLPEMLGLSQVTAGSMIRRGIVRWDGDWGSSGGFVFTPDGLDMMETFGGMDIGRKATYRPLSSAVTDRRVISQYETLRPALREAYRRAEAREARQSKHAKQRRTKMTIIKRKTRVA